jgi:hypothetical protein
MQAIEFEVESEGRLIKIPEEYAEFASRHLKVVLLMDDIQQKKVESSEVSKVLPKAFLNPVKVSSYDNIGKRDDLYDR